MTDVEHWAQAFRSCSDGDQQLQAHARFYSCAFLLDMEEHRFLVRMHAGRVDDLAIDPGPLDQRYQFLIRASAETWRKFSQPVPEPMFHGIFAAAAQRDMRIEGDLLVLMQHLRSVTRQLELLRTVGAPV